MNNLSNFIDESTVVLNNLANPEGFYGEIVSNCLSTTFDGVNQWAVDLMQVQPGENILEIGFGTGQAIQLLAQQTHAARVIGVDTSAMMVSKAKRLNAEMVRRGQVSLQKADVAQLPDFDCRFDKVLAINSVMYWPEHKLERILKDLRSRMAPGGMIYFVMHRLYERFERGDFTPHIQQLLGELRKAGFSDVDGTVQGVTDREAAIAAGTYVCVALHGVNPAFVL
jgi:SAM-dependent methyltransferase